MTPLKPLSKPEFIALMAMVFATMAFSIDAMLPALPQIAAELSPDNPNRAQLVVTSFVLGMGIGTLFTGPLSDAFGRKPVLLTGAAIYCLASALAIVAQSLELMLAARLLQGIGAAGPRVVAMAIIRDLYKGRAMAQTMSFVMMVFTLVPAMAPTLGAAIITFAGWHGIFWAFLLFSATTMLWLGLRQPETLPPERRVPMRTATLWAALREVLGNPLVARSIAVQSLCMGILFSMISSTQPIFDVTFGRGESFPLWFGGIALVAATGTVLNASLVMRLGMRAIVNAVLGVQVVLSGLMMVVTLAGLWPDWLAFPAYVVWMGSIFFMVALCMGNMNALAMEPVGHIAGLAASVIGSVSTVAAVFIAVPVGLLFNGTILPLTVGVFLCASAAFAILQTILDPSVVRDRSI